MSAKPIYSSFRGSFASYVETLARLSISIWGIVSRECISRNHCGWSLSSSLVTSFPRLLADERVSFRYNSVKLHNCEPSQILRNILGRSPRFRGPSAEEVSTFAISREIIQSSSRVTVWPWAWARGRGKSSEREGMMHLFVYFLMIFMMQRPCN